MEIRIANQAGSKFSQIQQSPAKAEQRKSKKKAWISFDFLVRIEPFQWVMLTPWGKKILSVSFPPPPSEPAAPDPFRWSRSPRFKVAPPCSLFGKSKQHSIVSENRKEESRAKRRPRDH
jgi:hypothetical protein